MNYLLPTNQEITSVSNSTPPYQEHSNYPKSSKCLTKQSQAPNFSSQSKVNIIKISAQLMFNRHSHSEGAALKDVNAPAENLAGKKDMALVSPLRFINHKHKIHTILS